MGGSFDGGKLHSRICSNLLFSGISSSLVPATKRCPPHTCAFFHVVSQAKLRAACLGVKIRAENGLENALNSLSLFLSERTPTAAMPPHQPNTTGSRPFTTLPCTDTPMSALEHACAEEAGGNEVLVDGVSNQSSRGCGEGCGVRVGKDLGEEELVLREMPNGLKVWGGTNAEEETFYIYGEVFEDRTYARMGIRVQDGDTVWDVGEIHANDNYTRRFVRYASSVELGLVAPPCAQRNLF